MKKTDVREFYFNLENNLFEIQERLTSQTWCPDPYTSFFIRDPKLRHIHKDSVRDRVLNQAVFRVLYPIFDRHFVFDSYSCRKDKGVHQAILRLGKFLRKITSNYQSQTFVLKCDVRKFFDSISHQILFDLIKERIKDENVLALISLILNSFETKVGRGLPLGNVTSQLFANIYLNKFDQFVKHKLKIKYYIRYCDDFVILDKDKFKLINFISQINEFLKSELGLELHPKKVEIRKNTWGVDFLGYVLLPYYKVLRSKTKKRMIKNITKLKDKLDIKLITSDRFQKTLASYKGVLSHCSSYKIAKNFSFLC